MAHELPRLLVERLGAPEAKVAAARQLAEERQCPFVQVAVESGVVEEDAVADLAARELATVVVELDLGELDDESVRMVPSDIARRFLFVPLAPDPSGESIRVVFADPLDASAVEAAQKATGLGIQPLVATVSGVLSAIERVYGTSIEDTSVVRGGPKEIPAEETRRVESRSRGRSTDEFPEAAPATAPIHRIEDEATPEQGHRALLLALVDKGVLTRAEYLDALRRLLGKN